MSDEHVAAEQERTDAQRVAFTEEQQRELERILHDRLERERRRREQEVERAVQAARAELEAQLEALRKAAEERAQRVAELEAQLAQASDLEQRVAQYRDVIAEEVRRRLAHAPKLVQEALSRLDPVEQLRLLNEYGDELLHRAPVPPTPAPNGPKPISDDERRRRTVSVRDLW